MIRRQSPRAKARADSSPLRAYRYAIIPKQLVRTSCISLFSVKVQSPLRGWPLPLRACAHSVRVKRKIRLFALRA